VDAPEILVRVEGPVGRLTLNRPQALHALTTGMCQAMIEALLAWKDDAAIALRPSRWC
jgi:enoyl-CoA hydratase